MRLFKINGLESELDILNNVLAVPNSSIACVSNNAVDLMNVIKNSTWIDNTSNVPDFVNHDNKIMIEMYEVDDIVTRKKGKDNPQRKADAQAYREVDSFIDSLSINRDNINIIARGDTRYNKNTDTYTDNIANEHHSYKAYINNCIRITNKHLNSIPNYKKNHHYYKLGFLIIDDSTIYLPSNILTMNKINCVTEFDIISHYPFYDKNIMDLFINSDVDFILWAFNNKYIYTDDNPIGNRDLLPTLWLIPKDEYLSEYSKSFNIADMVSSET